MELQSQTATEAASLQHLRTPAMCLVALALTLSACATYAPDPLPPDRFEALSTERQEIGPNGPNDESGELSLGKAAEWLRTRGPRVRETIAAYRTALARAGVQALGAELAVTNSASDLSHLVVESPRRQECFQRPHFPRPRRTPRSSASGERSSSKNTLPCFACGPTNEVVERQLHLEITEQYPDPTFGSSLGGEAGERKRTLGLSLGIEIPLFDRNQQVIAEAKSREKLRITRAQLNASSPRSNARTQPWCWRPRSIASPEMSDPQKNPYAPRTSTTFVAAPAGRTGRGTPRTRVGWQSAP